MIFSATWASIFLISSSNCPSIAILDEIAEVVLLVDPARGRMEVEQNHRPLAADAVLVHFHVVVLVVELRALAIRLGRSRPAGRIDDRLRLPPLVEQRLTRLHPGAVGREMDVELVPHGAVAPDLVARDGPVRVRAALRLPWLEEQHEDEAIGVA